MTQITCIVFGAAFACAGALFATGRLLPRIDAWRAMPEEERAAIRSGALCRNVGALIATAGAILLLAGLVPAFLEHGFMAAMVAWFVVAGIEAHLIGKPGRYDRGGDAEGR